MNISANVLAQMRKNCAPAMSAVQEKVSKFAAENGAKVRPNLWAGFNAEFALTHDVMVCVQPDKRIRIIPVRRDRVFAHHVGELLKTCVLLWVREENAYPVGWDNWRWVYQRLVRATDIQQYDSELSECEEKRLRTKQQKLAEFYDLAKPDRYKKLGKRGYNLSFDEIRALRRQEAYEKRLYGTIEVAKDIMKKCCC